MKLKKLVILKALDQTLNEKSIYNYEYKNGRHSITEDKVAQPGWKEAVKELNNKIDKLTDMVLDGFVQVNKRLDKVEERLDRVEQDIRDIKECPTIKRELKLSKQK